MHNKVLKTGHKNRGLGRSLRSRRLAQRHVNNQITAGKFKWLAATINKELTT